MCTASATRSTRSTVMTASAVSEETVAPAAPIAMPRSASASAGASLTPSPTMITGRELRVVAQRVGRPRACPRASARRRRGRRRAARPIALGDRAAVAGDHRDVADALGAQPLDDPLGVGAQLVGHHDHAGRHAPSTPTSTCASPEPRPVSERGAGDLVRVVALARAGTRGCRPPRGGRRRVPAMPWPGSSRDVGRGSSSASAGLARGAHERLAEHVGRHAGRPTRRAAAPRPGRRPSSVTTSRTSGVPTVSVPVLSNSTVRASPSVSIAPAPLTITPPRAARERPETSAIGAARISGHGVATTTTASARTGSPLSAQASAGDDQRRPGGRSRRSGRPCARTARAGPAPARPAARAPRRRSRPPAGRRAGRTARRRSPMPLSTGMPRRSVTGSGSPVSVLVSTTASALTTRPVDRDHLAGPHDDHVARPHLVDRHLARCRSPTRSCATLRGPLDQRRELAPGARRGARPRALRRRRTSGR